MSNTGPVRTCVACRARRPQRELLRVRRRPDGVIAPAVARRPSLAGRSAYVCPGGDCLQQAGRRRALERSLGKGGRVLEPDLGELRAALRAALVDQLHTSIRSGAQPSIPRLAGIDAAIVAIDGAIAQHHPASRGASGRGA